MDIELNKTLKQSQVKAKQKSRKGLNILEGILRLLGFIGAAFPVLALLFIAAVLLVSVFPSILYNGLGFLYHQNWNFGNFYSNATVTHNGIQAPVGASYGALPFIAGTLLTSVIAILIGVPVAVGAALILVEKIPRRCPACTFLFSGIAGRHSQRGVWFVGTDRVGSISSRSYLSNHRQVGSHYPLAGATRRFRARTADRRDRPGGDDHPHRRFYHARFARPGTQLTT